MMVRYVTYLSSGTLLALFVVPHIANAQLGEVDTFCSSAVGFITDIMVPAVFAIALVAFLWGVTNYLILGGGDEKKREQGKSLMLYAVIGFVLMSAIWGIVNFLAVGIMSGTNPAGSGKADATLKIIPDTPSR